jgi:CRP-like cAMP-binding protein
VSQIKQSAVRNRLLAALPPADFQRLSASLTLVSLSLKQTLLEADEPIGDAYFVETGMVSYLAYLENGDAIEVGSSAPRAWSGCR